MLGDFFSQTYLLTLVGSDVTLPVFFFFYGPTEVPRCRRSHGKVRPLKALTIISNHFQICCVKPVVDFSLLSSVVPIGGYEMPEKIKKFHLCNNVQKFQYDRPFHRGTKAKDNEFKVRCRIPELKQNKL
jgi:hypothetical protein